MSQDAVRESKEAILIAFAQLLSKYNQQSVKIATKEEELEKEKNKVLLEKASDYTVDSIVNSMASLQLDFGRIISELSERLTTEASKLDELKKAIAVKQEQLEELRKVRLVSDALHLLRQEHQERIRSLEKRTNEQREKIEKETIQQRKIWQKEQEEFEAKLAEKVELTTKQREKETADYQYQIQITRKIETDQYEETKRQQERELQGMNKEKEKGWKEREKMLKDNEKQFQENQQKIAGFEAKLKEEYNKAKGEAIKEADKEAKIKADLFEKDWELTKQGYELKIQSLEAAIEHNNQQIAEIVAQLQTATTQAQNLALRAFQTTDNQSSKNS